MKYILRLRHEVQANLATVWIIEKHGEALECRMFGTMFVDAAERLAELLAGKGVKVERTTFDGERHDEPKPETVMEKQGELWASENATT